MKLPIRFVLPLAGFLVVAVILGIALKRAPEAGQAFVKSALIGKPAPEFTLPSVIPNAEDVSLAQFKGRWTLLNVWGTWCVECRVEHPVLLDIQREGKVTIIGLDYKDEDAAALEWLDRLGNPYAAVAADREGRAAIDFGVYGAPETFLIDPQGVIVHKQVGPVSKAIWQTDFLPKIEAKP
ncbi:MAG: DsbE family thiol:disulfide interchange protein [Steroidobacteraceae bacterium]